MRTILLNRNLTLTFITILIIVGLISLIPVPDYFTREQQWTILVLLFAIFLWVASPIPTAASSLLIISLLILLNLVDTVEEALIGFLTPALYFILVLSLISNALVKIDVDRVFARLLVKFSKGGPLHLVISLPVIVLFMPIVLPSAVARFKMMLPLIYSLNNYYGYDRQSVFNKYSVYLIGMVNQNATIVIFTGGGFPILAHQLLKDYQIANLSWIEWVLMMGPPLWIGSIIMVFIIFNYLKLLYPKSNFKRVATTEILGLKNDKLPPKFWVTLLSFLIMIFVWIVTDEDRVPLILPPMLLIAFYAIPKMGLVTNKMVQAYDWENFLMLGASFSLGGVLMKNGTADTIAHLLISFMPVDTGMTLKIIIVAAIIFLLRFLFIVPSAALVVIFPIVMSYSDLLGIPEFQLAFLVILIVGSMMVLPIHTTTTYLAFETQVLTKKEQYTIGFVFSLVFMIISILSALYFW
ncbi:SLC13 family permease [Oceanobacillus luteolus]|uniref:SLC13 family permease n=2 Tax=Oceanobacillus luteolus TaxID=1274358 RepID=A0ABW4HYB9_9BACI